MKTGIVKFFDSREGKKYGFVTTEIGGKKVNVFFHFDAGSRIVSGNDSPWFVGGRVKVEPKRGDEITFNCKSGDKGIKVKQWCFTKDYLEAKSRSGDTQLTIGSICSFRSLSTA